MNDREITTRIDALDVEGFLAHYWQKKPLLIRGAFPEFESPLTADELAGLACDEDVESRLVDANFRLRNGPFTEQDFSSLPETGWTLLVQDVEKHLPDLAGILDHFRCIPSWRVDDLMISVAAKDGGVGPHVDAYDVFLLQAHGRRRWSIAEHFDSTHIEGIDLKVLETFTAEQEWVLEPGDMLYLPPNVAHDGVAVDDGCMTWSIGFRAPDAQGMLSDLVELVQQGIPDRLMYTDPDLFADEAHDGRISEAALQRARAMVRGLLQLDDAYIDEWFGRFVTEPKPWLEVQANEEIDANVLAERLVAGEILFRDTRTQLAWTGGNRLHLFVDGDAWGVAPALQPLLGLLCTERQLSHALLRSYLESEAALELLVRLHNHGSLYFIDED